MSAPSSWRRSREGALRAPRTPVPDSRKQDVQDAVNNAPASADVPAANRGAVLSAQARTLDSRLLVAAQNDRQATRRAAAHVVQLARRMARLLPRVPSLLPVLPDGGRDARVRHYVLQTQSVVGARRTRILTISTHSVLRYGEFDGSGKPVLWNEYDPLQPAVGWGLEIVLERLGEVLGQITAHVESLEARVAERAKTLNSLLNSAPVSNRPLVARVITKAEPPAAAPRAIAPPATGRAGAAGAASISSQAEAAASPGLVELPSGTAPETDDTMPELALIDLAFGEIPVDYEEAVASMSTDPPAEPTEECPTPSFDGSAVGSAAPDDSMSAEAIAAKEKRERRLFQHLRAR